MVGFINNKAIRITIRAIATLLIIAFLSQDITWAYPDRIPAPSVQNDKLAAQSFFKEGELTQKKILVFGRIIEEIVEHNPTVPRVNLTLDAIKAILNKHRDDEWFKVNIGYQEYGNEVLIDVGAGNRLRYYNHNIFTGSEYPNVCAAWRINRNLSKQLIKIDSPTTPAPQATSHQLTANSAQPADQPTSKTGLIETIQKDLTISKKQLILGLFAFLVVILSANPEDIIFIAIVGGAMIAVRFLPRIIAYIDNDNAGNKGSGIDGIGTNDEKKAASPLSRRSFLALSLGTAALLSGCSRSFSVAKIFMGRNSDKIEAVVAKKFDANFKSSAQGVVYGFEGLGSNNAKEYMGWLLSKHLPYISSMMATDDMEEAMKKAAGIERLYEGGMNVALCYSCSDSIFGLGGKNSFLSELDKRNIGVDVLVMFDDNWPIGGIPKNVKYVINLRQGGFLGGRKLTPDLLASPDTICVDVNIGGISHLGFPLPPEKTGSKEESLACAEYTPIIVKIIDFVYNEKLAANKKGAMLAKESMRDMLERDYPGRISVMKDSKIITIKPAKVRNDRILGASVELSSQISTIGSISGAEGTSQGDGFICQGEKSWKIFQSQLDEVRKNDKNYFTAIYGGSIAGLMESFSQKIFKDNPDIQRKLSDQAAKFRSGECKIYGFKSVIAGENDFVLGWNNQGNELFIATDVIDELRANGSGTLVNEYLLHEAICPILEHRPSIRYQREYFGRKHYPKEGRADSPDNPYKGLLGKRLRKIINRGVYNNFALSNIAERMLIPYLKERLKGPDKIGSREAAVEIGDIGTDEAVGLLFEFLTSSADSPSHSVSYDAFSCILAFTRCAGNPLVRARAMKIYRNLSLKPALRAAALEILSYSLSGDEAVALLLEAAESAKLETIIITTAIRHLRTFLMRDIRANDIISAYIKAYEQHKEEGSLRYEVLESFGVARRRTERIERFIRQVAESANKRLSEKARIVLEGLTRGGADASGPVTLFSLGLLSPGILLSDNPSSLTVFFVSLAIILGILSIIYNLAEPYLVKMLDKFVIARRPRQPMTGRADEAIPKVVRTRSIRSSLMRLFRPFGARNDETGLPKSAVWRNALDTIVGDDFLMGLARKGELLNANLAQYPLGHTPETISKDLFDHLIELGYFTRVEETPKSYRSTELCRTYITCKDTVDKFLQKHPDYPIDEEGKNITALFKVIEVFDVDPREPFNFIESLLDKGILDIKDAPCLVFIALRCKAASSNMHVAVADIVVLLRERDIFSTIAEAGDENVGLLLCAISELMNDKKLGKDYVVDVIIPLIKENPIVGHMTADDILFLMDLVPKDKAVEFLRPFLAISKDKDDFIKIMRFVKIFMDDGHFTADEITEYILPIFREGGSDIGTLTRGMIATVNANILSKKELPRFILPIIKLLGKETAKFFSYYNRSFNPKVTEFQPQLFMSPTFMVFVTSYREQNFTEAEVKDKLVMPLLSVAMANIKIVRDSKDIEPEDKQKLEEELDFLRELKRSLAPMDERAKEYAAVLFASPPASRKDTLSAIDALGDTRSENARLALEVYWRKGKISEDKEMKFAILNALATIGSEKSLSLLADIAGNEGEDEIIRRSARKIAKEIENELYRHTKAEQRKPPEGSPPQGLSSYIWGSTIQYLSESRKWSGLSISALLGGLEEVFFSGALVSGIALGTYLLGWGGIPGYAFGVAISTFLFPAGHRKAVYRLENGVLVPRGPPTEQDLGKITLLGLALRFVYLSLIAFLPLYNYNILFALPAVMILHSLYNVVIAPRLNLPLGMAGSREEYRALVAEAEKVSGNENEYLTAEEEMAIFKKLRSLEDVLKKEEEPREKSRLRAQIKEAEGYLFEKYQNLAVHIYYKLRRSKGWPHKYDDDGLAAARQGLLFAIQDFDLSEECRFTTFAYPTIRGTILNEVSLKHIISIPLPAMGARLWLVKAIEKLTQTLGYKPTPDEIAGYVNKRMSNHEKALVGLGLGDIGSKQEATKQLRRMRKDCPDPNKVKLISRLLEERPIYEWVDYPKCDIPNTVASLLYSGMQSSSEDDLREIAVDGSFDTEELPLLGLLGEREREILILKSEGLRNKEIGEKIGITRERVRQILNEAREKLKALIEEEVIVTRSSTEGQETKSFKIMRDRPSKDHDKILKEAEGKTAIGERIKAIRRGLGLSWAELAQKAEIEDFWDIWRIEKGEMHMRLRGILLRLRTTLVSEMRLYKYRIFNMLIAPPEDAERIIKDAKRLPDIRERIKVLMRGISWPFSTLYLVSGLSDSILQYLNQPGPVFISRNTLKDIIAILGHEYGVREEDMDRFVEDMLRTKGKGGSGSVTLFSFSPPAILCLLYKICQPLLKKIIRKFLPRPEQQKVVSRSELGDEEYGRLPGETEAAYLLRRGKAKIKGPDKYDPIGMTKKQFIQVLIKNARYYEQVLSSRFMSILTDSAVTNAVTVAETKAALLVLAEDDIRLTDLINGINSTGMKKEEFIQTLKNAIYHYSSLYSKFMNIFTDSTVTSAITAFETKAALRKLAPADIDLIGLIESIDSTGFLDLENAFMCSDVTKEQRKEIVEILMCHMHPPYEGPVEYEGAKEARACAMEVVEEILSVNRPFVYGTLQMYKDVLNAMWPTVVELKGRRHFVQYRKDVFSCLARAMDRNQRLRDLVSAYSKLDDTKKDNTKKREFSQEMMLFYKNFPRVWENPNPKREWSYLTELINETKRRYRDYYKEEMVKKTDLVPLEEITKIMGKQVYRKDETSQISGVFKMRGVIVGVDKVMLRHIEAIRQDKTGTLKDKAFYIITQTTGNHGAAMIRAVTMLIQRYKRLYPELTSALNNIEPAVFTYKKLEPVKMKRLNEELDLYRETVGSKIKGSILTDGCKNYDDAKTARIEFNEKVGADAAYIEHGGMDVMTGYASLGIEVAEQLKKLGVSDDKKVVLLTSVCEGGPVGFVVGLKSERANSEGVLVQTRPYCSFVRSLITGRMEENDVNPKPTIILKNRPVVFESGIAGVAAQEPAVKAARKVIDAAVVVDPELNLNRAAPILYNDLRKSEGEGNVVVGGTTSAAVEALLEYGNTLDAIKKADVIVIVDMESSVDPDVTDYIHERLGMEEGREAVGKITELCIDAQYARVEEHNLPAALEILKEARAIFEEKKGINIVRNETAHTIIDEYTRLAEWNIKRRNLALAEELLAEAYNIFKKYIDADGVKDEAEFIIAGYTSLATAYIRQHRLEMGEISLARADEIFTRYPDAKNVENQAKYIVSGYTFLTTELTKIHEFDKAERAVARAREIMVNTPKARNIREQAEYIISCYTFLASSYTRSGQYHEAEVALAKANEVLTQYADLKDARDEARFIIGNYTFLASELITRGRFHEEAEAFKKAEECLRAAHDIFLGYPDAEGIGREACYIMRGYIRLAAHCPDLADEIREFENKAASPGRDIVSEVVLSFLCLKTGNLDRARQTAQAVLNLPDMSEGVYSIVNDLLAVTKAVNEMKKAEDIGEVNRIASDVRYIFCSEIRFILNQARTTRVAELGIVPRNPSLGMAPLFWDKIPYLNRLIPYLHDKRKWSYRKISLLGGSEEPIFTWALMSPTAWLFGHYLGVPIHIGLTVGFFISYLAFMMLHVQSVYRINYQDGSLTRGPPEDRDFYALVLLRVFANIFYIAALSFLNYYHMTSGLGPVNNVLALIPSILTHSFYNYSIAPRWSLALGITPGAADGMKIEDQLAEIGDALIRNPQWDNEPYDELIDHLDTNAKSVLARYTNRTAKQDFLKSILRCVPREKKIHIDSEDNTRKIVLHGRLYDAFKGLEVDETTAREYADIVSTTLIQYNPTSLNDLADRGILTDDERVLIDKRNLDKFNAVPLAQRVLKLVESYRLAGIAKSKQPMLLANFFDMQEIMNMHLLYRRYYITQRVVEEVCMRHPANPRAKVSSIMQSAEFKRCEYLKPYYIVEACIRHPDDTGTFLKRVIQKFEQVAQEGRYPHVKPSLIFRACFYSLDDPGRYFARYASQKKKQRTTYNEAPGGRQAAPKAPDVPKSPDVTKDEFGSNENFFRFDTKAYTQTPDMSEVTDEDYNIAKNIIYSTIYDINRREAVENGVQSIIMKNWVSVRHFTGSLLPTIICYKNGAIDINENFVRLFALLRKRGMGSFGVWDDKYRAHSNLLYSILYSIILHEIRGHYYVKNGKVRFREDEAVAQMKRGFKYHRLNVEAILFYWLAICENRQEEDLRNRAIEFLDEVEPNSDRTYADILGVNDKKREFLAHRLVEFARLARNMGILPLTYVPSGETEESVVEEILKRAGKQVFVTNEGVSASGGISDETGIDERLANFMTRIEAKLPTTAPSPGSPESRLLELHIDKLKVVLKWPELTWEDVKALVPRANAKLADLGSLRRFEIDELQQIFKIIFLTSKAVSQGPASSSPTNQPQDLEVIVKVLSKALEPVEQRHVDLDGAVWKLTSEGIYIPSSLMDVGMTLREAGIAKGTKFLDMGSGLGHTTFLAAMLGADACGVEVDRELYEDSREGLEILKREPIFRDKSVRFENGNFLDEDFNISGYDLLFWCCGDEVKAGVSAGERLRRKIGSTRFKPGTRLVVYGSGVWNDYNIMKRSSSNRLIPYCIYVAGEDGSFITKKETLEATTAYATRDGVAPPDFYVTTNRPTQIFYGGRWIDVERPFKNGAIVVDGSGFGRAVLLSEIKGDDRIVLDKGSVRVDEVAAKEKKALASAKDTAEKLLEMKKAHKKTLLVLGPVVVHTGRYDDVAWLIENGFVDMVFSGNAIATHDLERAIYGTSLGRNLETTETVNGGHEHHLRTINLVCKSGSIKQFLIDYKIADGIMAALHRRNIPFVLGGSPRDDGPLPEVITDTQKAVREMINKGYEADFALMLGSTLHSAAAASLLPHKTEIAVCDMNMDNIDEVLKNSDSCNASGIKAHVEEFLPDIRKTLENMMSEEGIAVTAVIKDPARVYMKNNPAFPEIVERHEEFVKPVVRTIRLKGHLLDQKVLSQVLDIITAHNESGKPKNSDVRYIEQKIELAGEKESSFMIQIFARDQATMSEILTGLDAIRDVTIIEERNARLEQASRDKVVPDDAHITSNYEFMIRVGGEWKSVNGRKMDAVIRWDPRAQNAETVKLSDVRAGDFIVAGSDGVREIIPAKEKGAQTAFEFMRSDISSEKPKETIISQVAGKMLAIKNKELKVMVVAGEKTIEGRGGEPIIWLITHGYIDILSCTNGFVLEDAKRRKAAELRHKLSDKEEMYLINDIKASGGLRAARERGLLGKVIGAAIDKGISVIIPGSKRDINPLPGVTIDILDSQKMTIENLEGVGMVLFSATTLHAIATGNVMPYEVTTVAVDQNPLVLTKLADRGTSQAIGIIADAGFFWNELCANVRKAGAATPAGDACVSPSDTSQASSDEYDPNQDTLGGQNTHDREQLRKDAAKVKILDFETVDAARFAEIAEFLIKEGMIPQDAEGHDNALRRAADLLNKYSHGMPDYCFIADYEGATIGIFMCSIYGNTANLYNMRVDTSFHRLGAGTRLFNAALDLAVSKGATSCHVTVDKTNEAQTFWRSMIPIEYQNNDIDGKLGDVTFPIFVSPTSSPFQTEPVSTASAAVQNAFQRDMSMTTGSQSDSTPPTSADVKDMDDYDPNEDILGGQDMSSREKLLKDAAKDPFIKLTTGNLPELVKKIEEERAAQNALDEKARKIFASVGNTDSVIPAPASPAGGAPAIPGTEIKTSPPLPTNDDKRTTIDEAKPAPSAPAGSRELGVGSMEAGVGSQDIRAQEHKIQDTRYISVSTLIKSIHDLAMPQGAQAPLISQGAKILISDTLFDVADREHLITLLGKDSPVQILSPKDIRNASINTKATKENLACVVSKEDYDNPDLWNRNHKVQNKATLLILNEDLKKERYLYLEGVVGLSSAMMRDDRNAINAYLRLLFTKSQDIDDSKLLELLISNPREFADYIRFKPIVPIETDELLNRYKSDVENYLVMA